MRNSNWLNLVLAIINTFTAIDSYQRQDYGLACFIFSVVGWLLAFYFVDLIDDK